MQGSQKSGLQSREYIGALAPLFINYPKPFFLVELDPSVKSCDT